MFQGCACTSHFSTTWIPSLFMKLVCAQQSFINIAVKMDVFFASSKRVLESNQLTLYLRSLSFAIVPMFSQNFLRFQFSNTVRVAESRGGSWEVLAFRPSSTSAQALWMQTPWYKYRPKLWKAKHQFIRDKKWPPSTILLGTTCKILSKAVIDIWQGFPRTFREALVEYKS